MLDLEMFSFSEDTIFHIFFPALQIPGGDYLLRGGRNNNGSQVNSVEAAGTVFHYLRHGPNSGDGISGQGPIEHPLNVLVSEY